MTSELPTRQPFPRSPLLELVSKIEAFEGAIFSFDKAKTLTQALAENPAAPTYRQLVEGILGLWLNAVVEEAEGICKASAPIGNLDLQTMLVNIDNRFPLFLRRVVLKKCFDEATPKRKPLIRAILKDQKLDDWMRREITVRWGDHQRKLWKYAATPNRFAWNAFARENETVPGEQQQTSVAPPSAKQNKDENGRRPRIGPLSSYELVYDPVRFASDELLDLRKPDSKKTTPVSRQEIGAGRTQWHVLRWCIEKAHCDRPAIGQPKNFTVEKCDLNKNLREFFGDSRNPIGRDNRPSFRVVDPSEAPLSYGGSDAGLSD